MTMLFPIILAGGGGTRLWPLSREQYPKQFLKLGRAATLLQQTLRRLDGLASMPDSASYPLTLPPPIIVCNEDHRFLVTEQARQVEVEPSSIMLEPVGRNTAPALTCAALVCQARSPECVVLMMPADHVVQNPEAFCRAVLRGIGLVQADYLVTFGVAPTKPETGYGYIERGAEIDRGRDAIAPHKAYQVKAFAEKPDAERAQCAPIGLYTVQTAADLGVTDLVAVDAPEPLASFLKEREYLPRGVPLMKRIAALPGQTVCRIGRNVTVDTIATGEVLTHDRHGRELPVWQGCRTLGAGEIFLMNWDVQDSLDGRYFGPIPKDSIIGRALPLWTDEGGDGRYLWRAPTH